MIGLFDETGAVAMTALFRLRLFCFGKSAKLVKQRARHRNPYIVSVISHLRAFRQNYLTSGLNPKRATI